MHFAIKCLIFLHITNFQFESYLNEWDGRFLKITRGTIASLDGN